MKNADLWLWYTEKTTMTRKVKLDLYREFNDIKKLYKAQEDDYKKFEYLSKESIDELCDKTKDYDALINLYKRNQVKIVTIDMDEYPQLLKNIYNPPLLLYCRGKFIDLNKKLCVAVVGTRKMTDYGKNIAYNFSKELAQAGVVVVSGLADGIDACAHRGAMDAGMPTVAVIGTGVNLVYPKVNAPLLKELLKTGMVISEYPLNSPPEKFHFPERNRIIAGVSAGTLVVEADIKSGSLITSKYAQEEGRDVFAVPGNINSIYSKGTNYLIKDGAYCVTCAEDIISQYRYKYDEFIISGMNEQEEHNNIEEFDYEQEKSQNDLERDILSADELILSVLSDEPMQIDEILEKTRIDISVLNSTLLIMELSGKIRKTAGNSYCIGNI